jgi:hypothetical protein
MTIAKTVSDFAAEVAPAIGTLALAAVTWLCVKATAWVHARTKNALVTGMMDRLSTEVQSAVAAADQLAVADIKAASANGKLTAADAVKVKSDVLAQIKANLGGDAGVAKATKILGVEDIEGYISSKIEAAVKALAASAPATPVPPVVNLSTTVPAPAPAA